MGKIVKMSLSSFYQVWKDQGVKNRGRLLQIKRILIALARRRSRLQTNAGWHGWWEQTLLRRKACKVRQVVVLGVLRSCLAAWLNNSKVQMVGRSLIKAAIIQERGYQDLVKATWRAWVQYGRDQGRMRKTEQYLLNKSQGRTMKDFIHNWRSVAASSLLKRAGFGSKSKDNKKVQLPQRTTSADSFQSGQETQKSAFAVHQGFSRTLSSSSQHAGRGSVGRTRSPGISRTASCASIVESDDDSDHSLSRPLHAEGSSRALRRTLSTDSKQSNASSASMRSTMASIRGGTRSNIDTGQLSQDSISSASGASSGLRSPKGAASARTSSSTSRDSASSPRSPRPKGTSFARRASTASRDSGVSTRLSPLAASHARERRGSLFAPATEYEKSVAREGASTEAFLSTLLRAASVNAV